MWMQILCCNAITLKHIECTAKHYNSCRHALGDSGSGVEIISSSKHTMFDKQRLGDASIKPDWSWWMQLWHSLETERPCVDYKPAHAFLLQILPTLASATESQAWLCRVTVTQRVQLECLIFIPVKSCLTATGTILQLLLKLDFYNSLDWVVPSWQ